MEIHWATKIGWIGTFPRKKSISNAKLNWKRCTLQRLSLTPILAWIILRWSCTGIPSSIKTDPYALQSCFSTAQNGCQWSAAIVCPTAHFASEMHPMNCQATFHQLSPIRVLGDPFWNNFYALAFSGMLVHNTDHWPSAKQTNIVNQFFTTFQGFSFCSIPWVSIFHL